jgi:ribonuclease HI
MNKNSLGAWAYLIQMPDGEVVEASWAEFGTTNNRMEMTAVMKALEVLEIGKPIKIIADSEYVIKGATIWCRKWIRNGWMTMAGQPVVNKDLWEPLMALCQLHDVRFEHVKGHSGHPYNERVDQLCTKAMADAHEGLLIEAMGDK